jgi:hypothetical protein
MFIFYAPFSNLHFFQILLNPASCGTESPKPQLLGLLEPPIHRSKKSPAWESVDKDQRSNKLVNGITAPPRNGALAVSVCVFSKCAHFWQAGKASCEVIFFILRRREFIGFSTCSGPRRRKGRTRCRNDSQLAIHASPIFRNDDAAAPSERRGGPGRICSGCI